MTQAPPLIEFLPDGTLRHRHPVTGQEVWNVQGRSFRPNRTQKKEHPPQILPVPLGPEETCDFCATRRLETPPEKARWWRAPSGTWKTQTFRSPGLIPEGPCDFRRISNLFEIVPYSHWVRNLGATPSPERVAWRDAYLSDATGQRHIKTLLRNKLKKAGWDDTRLSTLDEKTLRTLSEPFFFGSHDLIVSNGHFKHGARLDNEVQSSGDLDSDSHFHYLQAATETAQDILAHNPLARYVAIFQNWLSPSGASFEHLHKQVLGTDEPGPYPDALMKAVQNDRGLFNRRFLAPALEQDWALVENAHAVALAAFGVPYPAIWVFSKSRASRPWELTRDELRGFSDVLHACHAATGSDIPTNEEWNYSPLGASAPIPFHVTLKWRVNVHAGYEGVSGTVISPLGPGELKDRLISRTKSLIALGRLGQVGFASRSVEPLPEHEC
jgi:galactose-1-phosphate uridylyltransferase